MLEWQEERYSVGGCITLNYRAQLQTKRFKVFKTRTKIYNSSDIFCKCNLEFESIHNISISILHSSFPLDVVVNSYLLVRRLNRFK